MSSPLYKKLKPNGTSFYAFPGSAEDISASYQNSNYKMYFSKYALLNFPKQNTSDTSNPIYFDFENVFNKSANATPALNYSEFMVESLRNYVANQETVIRESRLSTNKYFYDTNALETTTEKIFWKWCKKLNILDLEQAIPSDEYFDNLKEFESNDINDDEYHPEYLWKEREIVDWDAITFMETGDVDNVNKLEIVFSGETNFKVGDIANIYYVSNSTILGSIGEDAGTEAGINAKVLKVIPAGTGATEGESIVVDIESTIAETVETTGQARVVYNRLIRYIGEVNGVSNVQEANRSYTEVYAHIPDHTGQTPDVLFRTRYDDNYKPNMVFPIIPAQYQPEIMGAEIFTSPIVNSPQNYPGSYFGQFDTLDFTYTVENGDYLRRSGDYFGVAGDTNEPIFDSTTLDGLTVDFDINHYVKMNIPNRTVTNFDQFNALTVNNEPPKDFEFNAILWYYTVEDNKGNTRSNLYGITFLDHPDNNQVDDDISLRFPTYKKLVTNGEQDGTSYAFNLSLNFNIINENPTDTYNPQAINSLFNMNLFNDAMAKLSSTNDSFLNILAEQNFVREEITNVKGLLYTQTDINTINNKIRNLEYLLRLYSSGQLQSSETINVNKISGNPPLYTLDDISTNYYRVENVKSSELYDSISVLPMNISIPKNRNFLINITNDDTIDLSLDDNLTIVLDKDLYLNQTIDINISGSEDSIYNKKLNIFMVSDSNSVNGEENEVLILGELDLPVFYNNINQLPNSAYLWKEFKFEIDLDDDIILSSENILEIPLSGNQTIITNSINNGDTLYLNNFFVGETSVYDYSGQYKVDEVSENYIKLDVSSNKDFITSNSYPYTIHSSSSSLLANNPYISLNKGKNIKITRVSDSTILKERYYIQVSSII